MSNPNETPETPEEQAERVAASLAASGLGRAVEDAAGRDLPPVRLVPDLVDELTHPLSWLSEVLTGWGEDTLEDGEEFDDPAEAAAADAAEDAVDRILAAIRPTQTDPRTPSEIRVDGRWVPQSTAPAGYAGRLLDGNMELTPLRLIEGITTEDVDTVIDICERIIGGRGYLTDAANEIASSWNNSPVDINESPTGGADYARRALGIMHLLERTPYVDEHAEILVNALRHHDPDTDLRLTGPQADAYRAWIHPALRVLAGTTDEDEES
ncbi:hypothetical protein [Glycomyces artemisiae]|uniref:Uncharacterized protein n=1 Tax=Glycomyces artemisiae TaxID=1076443 RepID=A0A2T0U6G0_9ACTN|nr:hypothetical protein [Glycomyces artemisiae]PRY53515.1 hypothetical protein B0I28_11714 [Glycomyces artemisiae]